MSCNLLVCGGLPRSATTFLHNELLNHTNVFRSKIKESHLFNRSAAFIDWKLNSLSSRYVYLDFTPEYIFDKHAIKKILDRQIKFFFVLREYDDYRDSLERYLRINKINNPFLMDLTKAQFDESVGFAIEHFPYFRFEDICNNLPSVMTRLKNLFEFDFGTEIEHRETRNSSQKRIYHVFNRIHNNFESPFKVTKSFLFGFA